MSFKVAQTVQQFVQIRYIDSLTTLLPIQKRWDLHHDMEPLQVALNIRSIHQMNRKYQLNHRPDVILPAKIISPVFLC
jgi:hypothetical protein